MKQSIGFTYTLNFVILFIVITFAFLVGIMSYYKAFKVNSQIANAIENHEGYNALSASEIDRILTSLGYTKGQVKCPTRTHNGKDYTSVSNNDFAICIYDYEAEEQTAIRKSGYHFKYGIVTYISMDLPIIGKTLKLPIYTETEKIFKFTENK